MKYKFITAALLTALSAGAAADHHRMGGKMFNRMDQNGDGLLSVDEFQAPPRGGMLGRGDTDGDGIVTIEELRAQHEERQAMMQAKIEERGGKMLARIESLDQDGDGVVTRDEARLATFDALDEDGDGYLSADEMRPPRDRDDRGHKKGKQKGKMGKKQRDS